MNLIDIKEGLGGENAEKKKTQNKTSVVLHPDYTICGK